MLHSPEARYPSSGEVIQPPRPDAHRTAVWIPFSSGRARGRTCCSRWLKKIRLI